MNLSFAKLCLFIFFFISGLPTISQVEIKTIPPEGVLLDKGWKFHAGDNVEWAKKNFNDSTWQNIDPTEDINNFSELRKSEIGWLRLHIHIDQSLLNKPVAFKIRQIGASEIYINGVNVLRLGVVSTDPEKEVIFNPNKKPYSFMFSLDTEQVIAVRYSFTRSNPYFNNQGMGNPTFILQLLSAQASLNELIFQKSYSSAIVFAEVGFLFLLFLLHLFFYLAYKEKKSNLYYSAFAFGAMIYYWLWFLAFHVPREGSSFFALSAVAYIFGIPALFFALNAVYSYVGEKKVGYTVSYFFACYSLFR